MAAGFSAHLLPGAYVESAGIRVSADAQQADDRAIAAMAARGIDITGHRPQQLSRSHRNFDRVVVLDRAAADVLRREFDFEEGTIVEMFVDDPHGGSLADYDRCASTITEKLGGLLNSGELST